MGEDSFKVRQIFYSGVQSRPGVMEKVRAGRSAAAACPTEEGPHPNPEQADCVHFNTHPGFKRAFLAIRNCAGDTGWYLHIRKRAWTLELVTVSGFRHPVWLSINNPVRPLMMTQTIYH